jgi:hypothetical protein
MVMNGLHSYWPDLKIVGEETTSFKGELLYDYMQFSQPFKQNILGIENHKDEELNI